MPQRRYETIIDSTTDASGSAEFYAHDNTRFSLAILTADTTGTAACKYKIEIYPTGDTIDAAAVEYVGFAGSAAPVAVFDNLADAQGVPYVFYKVKISWTNLAGGILGAKDAAF